MPNKISRFWQELKRRNVVRVITVYGGAAFVIIELINNITDPLRLPEWTPTLVIVLLAIGFPIVIIFSWIYDVSPEGGMVKTEPADKVKTVEKPASSSSWKIATYVSVVIIIGLIAYNIFGGKRGPKVDESLSKSIAVLVFNNYTRDPDQDIMCEGLSDEIITDLFKIASFDEVRPLTSVKPFKDSKLSTIEIAQKLLVNYVLEGSLRRIGDDAVITVKLIEAKSDNHIWLEDYTLPYRTIMGIPGDIALKIAFNLKAFISDDVHQNIEKITTDNFEAYEIVKQIAYLYNKALSGTDLIALKQVQELAKKAIDLDPDYADAYAFLGISTLIGGNYGGNKEMRSVAPEAKRYCERAIKLDPYNLLANVGLALIRHWAERDHIAMEDIGLKYPNLLSSDVDYFTGYAMFNTQMGNLERVVSLPISGYPVENVLRAHVLLGNKDKVKNILEREAVEHRYLDYHLIGELYIWLQEFDTALYYLESALESGLPGINLPRYQADLAVAYFKNGKKDLARSIIGELIRASDTTTVGSPAYFTGWYYGWIEEPDSSFFWLEKAMENRSPEIPWLKEDPAFKSLEDDPRYSDLYVRAGFKAYDDYMASIDE